MYDLSYFKEPDPQRLLDFMEAHPFAFLAGSTLAGLPVATQVPLLAVQREGELYLQGHLMRNTDHHKAFEENPNVLAVFTGPNTYVSATWYTDPQQGSTWNYMSVHVSGPMRMMSDTELHHWMQGFSLKFEHGNTASKTVYDQLPQAYRDRMMPAIVGFEIHAAQVRNVFKLSQNRDRESYDNIRRELEAQGGDPAQIAQEMQQRRSELFPQDDTPKPNP